MKAAVRERTRKGIKARRHRPHARLDEATIRNEKTGSLVSADEEIKTTDAESEARALALPMAAAHRRTRMFYQSEYDGLPQAEINEKFDAHQRYLRESAEAAPVAEVSWQRIGAVADVDPQEAARIWCRVRSAASDELESGVRCARAAGASQPLEFARFLALRDYFTDAWNPQNFIEQSMIDMLAQSYSLFLYWSQVSHERSMNNVRELDTRLASKDPKLDGWKLPYQKEAEAIEQAAQMADRHNRLFLRTLRQMRDLRRYAPPVIVNNGGQVNVATNGGQQLNLAQG